MPTLPPLERVPGPLRERARRLLTLSPWFGRLTRELDAAGWRALCRPIDEARLPASTGAWLPDAPNDLPFAEAMRRLRECKHRGLRHVIWWELGLHGPVEDSYRALSAWADGLLETALTLARQTLAPRYGRLPGGRFTVIGLGKLGGRELNLGSDVDLLFVWGPPETGPASTVDGRRSVPAEVYFNELSRTLIRLFDERTPDGQVWPVDMRLRPGGAGAPLSLNIEATLDHYLNYGQTWERAMLIKARTVAGDRELGQDFIERLRPFIYRRYLDYSAVAALAEMKRRIDGQHGHRELGPGFDVKRGRGGIREIEFTIQAMQLLHGGRIPSLRIPESGRALAGLVDAGLVDARDADALSAAYDLWRRVEHSIQARQGERTQRLPDDYADYLGATLDITGVDETLTAHADRVHAIFTHRVLPIDEGRERNIDWLTAPPWPAHGVDRDRREAFAGALERIRATLDRGLLPERSHGQVRAILAAAMPRWLDDDNGPQAIDAFADLLISIAGRANWIDLLATHEGARTWLIGVLSASRYLSRQIVDHPELLEWPLLAERGETTIDTLCGEMEAIARDAGDEGEALRRLGRLVELARIECALLIDAQRADAMEIGAWLSEIADRAVQTCQRLTLSALGLPETFPITAVALGKHGSREMSLTSDLDLIFIFDMQAARSSMEGRERDPHETAQRIGRRLIRQLSGRPPFSAGYDFDGRLRPSGSSGILVTTLEGFADYQFNEAQTWEHQALCRARPVSGPGPLRQAVEAIVDAVVERPRDRESLARDVVAMRRKMIGHLARRDPSVIDLKQDPGGLVDIEFIAQFQRLLHHGRSRSTTGMLAEAIPSVSDAEGRDLAWLDETYRLYRRIDNALRVELWLSSSRIPRTADAPAWTTLGRHLGLADPDVLMQRMQGVHECFVRLLGDPAAG